MFKYFEYENFYLNSTFIYIWRLRECYSICMYVVDVTWMLLTSSFCYVLLQSNTSIWTGTQKSTIHTIQYRIYMYSNIYTECLELPVCRNKISACVNEWMGEREREKKCSLKRIRHEKKAHERITCIYIRYTRLYGKCEHSRLRMGSITKRTSKTKTHIISARVTHTL